MPINGLGAHKPCPLALDCMKACNTARAAKGGLRERSGAKGGEGGEGRLMASPRAASIPVGGRGRSRTRTPPPPESGPTHPGTVAGRAARRAGGGRKGEGGTREDRARGGRGKRKSASICGLRKRSVICDVICDVTEAMPINGLGAHKPCPLALDCMKACNTARAAKGGLRERSGAKGGEGGEGRLMASPRAASIPVGGRGRSRTRTPPPPESGPTHPGTVAGRAARRAGGGRKGEGGTREDRARGGRGKRKSASICGLRGGE